VISLSHRFIFIHVPKTAGTALADALAPFARPEPRTLLRRALRRLPVTQSPEHAYFRQHDTAADIRATLTPSVFDSFFSFAVVRDPFDHAVSYYEFMKEYRGRRHAQRARDMSFVEHLKYRLSPRPFYDKPFLRLPNQSFYLCDRDGRVLVDVVLHYERLAEGLGAVSARLGLGPLRLRAARRSVHRDGRPVADYYRDETAIDLVTKLYAPDFVNFDYPLRPNHAGSDTTSKPPY
jgi:hypothetical protein